MRGWGAKIKSNAICEIGQQKQVHLSLLISFLLVLPRTEFTPHGFVTFHLFCLTGSPPVLCSQGQLLNLLKHPLTLVNLHNKMNPKFMSAVLPAYTTHYSSFRMVETDWFTRGSWQLVLPFNYATDTFQGKSQYAISKLFRLCNILD